MHAVMSLEIIRHIHMHLERAHWSLCFIEIQIRLCKLCKLRNYGECITGKYTRLKLVNHSLIIRQNVLNRRFG